MALHLAPHLINLWFQDVSVPRLLVLLALHSQHMVISQGRILEEAVCTKSPLFYD